jgi:HK97 family phage portal protein
MAAVVSMGELVTVQTGWATSRRSVRMYNSYYYDYATMYRTQPNVRTCVEFLSRNIAQLGLHVFRIVSETDRERLRDHPLAQLLKRPLPPAMKLTYYRLIETLVSDMGVYHNGYWLKIRQGGQVKGLLPLPPMYVEVQGGLAPSGYELTVGGKMWPIPATDMVHLRGYNPENAASGLSPLETLRRVLAEEQAAGEYREGFWRNSARMNGIIKRPADAPDWSDTARERFLAEFEQLYSGEANSAKTAVLEEGMEWQEASFNAQESEYLNGRKLTREECARAYHIPLPMVGILDHATFSNIKEQHKNLYQDSLGPWLAMIEQDIELQLLPEFEDTAGVYAEFNIKEKMQGSFDEQVSALQSAVGRPWMSADEARATQNMRSMGGDAAQLVTPLNVLVGGQASPNDVDVSKARKAMGTKGIDPSSNELRERYQKKWVEVLSKHYRRQERAMVSRVPAAVGKADIGGVWFDADRWNDELATDLFRLNNLTAKAWAERMFGKMGQSVDDMDRFDALMLPWLEEHSRIQSEKFNGQVARELETAMTADDPLQAVKDLFGLAVTVWAVREAISAVTSAGNFGANEAARAIALRQKTWRVNSSNPRESHAAMDGETVGIRETFSNGLRWPGDPQGSADDNAGCQCSVEFS